MDDPTTPHLSTDQELDRRLDAIREQRGRLRLRHAQALSSLLEQRTDLRGVHALADHFADALRWSA